MSLSDTRTLRRAILEVSPSMVPAAKIRANKTSVFVNVTIVRVLDRWSDSFSDHCLDVQSPGLSNLTTVPFSSLWRAADQQLKLSFNRSENFFPLQPITWSIKIRGSCLENQLESTSSVLTFTPDAVQTAVARAALSTIAVGTFLGSVAAFSPAAATLVGQAAAAINLAECAPRSEKDLGFWEYPFQVRIGADASIGQSIGTSILNPTLVPAAVVLHLLCVLIGVICFSTSKDSTNLWLKWKKRLRFPLLGIVAWAMWLQPTITATVEVLHWSNGNYYVVLSLIFHGMALAAVSFFLSPRGFGAESIGDGWRDLPSSPGFCASFGCFFAVFKAQWRGFVLVELAAAVVTAIILGLKGYGEGECAVPAIVYIAVNTVALLAYAACRPCRLFAWNAFFILIHTMLSLGGVAAVLVQRDIVSVSVAAVLPLA